MSMIAKIDLLEAPSHTRHQESPGKWTEGADSWRREHQKGRTVVLVRGWAVPECWTIWAGRERQIVPGSRNRMRERARGKTE